MVAIFAGFQAQVAADDNSIILAQWQRRMLTCWMRAASLPRIFFNVSRPALHILHFLDVVDAFGHVSVRSPDVRRFLTINLTSLG